MADKRKLWNSVPWKTGTTVKLNRRSFKDLPSKIFFDKPLFYGDRNGRKPFTNRFVWASYYEVPCMRWLVWGCIEQMITQDHLLWPLLAIVPLFSVAVCRGAIHWIVSRQMLCLTLVRFQLQMPHLIRWFISIPLSTCSANLDWRFNKKSFNKKNLPSFLDRIKLFLLLQGHRIKPLSGLY